MYDYVLTIDSNLLNFHDVNVHMSSYIPTSFVGESRSVEPSLGRVQDHGYTYRTSPAPCNVSMRS